MRGLSGEEDGDRSEVCSSVFQLKELEFDPESYGKIGGDCQEPRLVSGTMLKQTSLVQWNARRLKYSQEAHRHGIKEALGNRHS